MQKVPRLCGVSVESRYRRLPPDARFAFEAQPQGQAGSQAQPMTLERGAEKVTLEYTLAGATAAQKDVIETIKKAARALS